MILHPKLYRLANQEKRVFNPMLYAQKIARRLLVSMGYENVNENHPYFAVRDYRNPGEEFSWADGLVEWQVI